MAPHKVRAVVDQLAYMRARRKMGRRTVRRRKVRKMNSLLSVLPPRCRHPPAASHLPPARGEQEGVTQLPRYVITPRNLATG